MTIDLSTARVGSEVTTHAGAKLVISSVERKEHSRRFAVMFNGYPDERWNYMFNGLLDDRERQRVMDIIAIFPPPMSDAERLVEIAKMLLDFPMPDVGDMYFSIHATKWNILLALAQGRSP